YIPARTSHRFGRGSLASQNAGTHTTGSNNIRGRKTMQIRLKDIRKTATALAAILAAGLMLTGSADAQEKTMSIGTGGTGGVYYPLGGAVANVLTKNLP